LRFTWGLSAGRGAGFTGGGGAAAAPARKGHAARDHAAVASVHVHSDVPHLHLPDQAPPRRRQGAEAAPQPRPEGPLFRDGLLRDPDRLLLSPPGVRVAPEPAIEAVVGAYEFAGHR